MGNKNGECWVIFECIMKTNYFLKFLAKIGKNIVILENNSYFCKLQESHFLVSIKILTATTDHLWKILLSPLVNIDPQHLIPL